MSPDAPLNHESTYFIIQVHFFTPGSCSLQFFTPTSHQNSRAISPINSKGWPIWETAGFHTRVLSRPIFLSSKWCAIDISWRYGSTTSVATHTGVSWRTFSIINTLGKVGSSLDSTSLLANLLWFSLMVSASMPQPLIVSVGSVLDFTHTTLTPLIGTIPFTLCCHISMTCRRLAFVIEQGPAIISIPPSTLTQFAPAINKKLKK